MANPDPKDEYIDVSNNMRSNGYMRFAQLTLFIVIMAGLLNLVFNKSFSGTPVALNVLKIGGMVIVFAFLIMERSATNYYNYYRRRAVDLEDVLNFRQYTALPNHRIFSAANAVLLLYIMFGAFWLASLWLQ